MPSAAFNKKMQLSDSLAQICGARQMSRPEVVKQLWKHIKANKLQDKNNGRQINNDQKMQNVFGKKTMDMMQMNKLLSKSLTKMSGGGNKQTTQKNKNQRSNTRNRNNNNSRRNNRSNNRRNNSRRNKNRN